MTGTHADKVAAVEGFRFPWPFPKHPPTRGYRLASYATLTFVRSLSRLLFFKGVNKLRVHNRERFIQLLEDRSRPLVTIANHRCNIDDPLMWCLISWKEFFRNIDRQRFTLAAHNICFTKQSHTTLFSLGQCVPCVRGEGVFQKGMDFSVEKLGERAWVHMFPEGKVNHENAPMRVKWGVGRLVLEPSVAPIVLPIWLTGMDTVWPAHPPYYPKFGNTVDITIGDPWDPQEFRDDLFKKDYSERQRRKVVADKVQRLLYSLGEKLGDLPRGTVGAVEKITDGKELDKYR